jgi:hypothetical protein
MSLHILKVKLLKGRNAMETKEKPPINYYLRIMHRYAGFFILGFAVIYGLSGITLIYRDTDFLKHDKKIALNLTPGINPSELGNALRMRDFKLEKTEGDILYFQGGTYNKTTGAAEITIKDLVFPFNKLTNLHKTPSKSPIHWFTFIFAITLLFLAISSLWMFKPGTKMFRKGILTVAVGLVVALVLLLFVK